jgi:hypothetical protein
MTFKSWYEKKHFAKVFYKIDLVSKATLKRWFITDRKWGELGPNEPTRQLSAYAGLNDIEMVDIEREITEEMRVVTLRVFKKYGIL